MEIAGGVTYWIVGAVTAAVILIATSIQLFLYLGRKKKENLMVRVKLDQGDDFTATVQRRMDHITQYIEGEDYSKPLLPDSFATITETNEWETAFDLNPDYRDSNWIGLSEYLSACKIQNRNSRQAVAESFLSTFQKLITKSSGLPFPITWFLPKKVKRGSLPMHPLQFIQISLVVTPSLLTSLAESKNFSDREIKRIHASKSDKPKKPTPDKLKSYLPANCKLSEVYEYFDEQPDAQPLGKPLNENIFPGLRKGFSPHNPPSFEGKHALRNRIFAEICNRFNKNIAHDVGLPTPIEGEDNFSLEMPDGTTIVRIDDLVEYLLDHECKVSCNIRVASAVMGVSFSVAKEAVGKENNEEDYFDVPFSFFMRTGVYSDRYKAEAIMPMLHGGMNLICEGNLEGFGDVSFTIQYYMLMHAYTRWNARNGPQDDIKWNPGKIVQEWNSRNDVIRAVRLAGWNAAIVNGIGKRENLYSCGYGTLGVCSDSVAPIQHVLTGSTNMYPILALGEYRMKILKEIRRLQSEIESEDSTKCREEDIKDLEDLFNSMTLLPNDNYLAPTDYKDTLYRISSSLPWEKGQEPFASVVIARKILQAELESIEYFEIKTPTSR